MKKSTAISIIMLLCLALIIGSIFKLIDNTNKAEREKAVLEAQYQHPCQISKKEIPNNTESGDQLVSCFVEYPDEITREDDKYYIVEDICGQFTQQFIENMSSLQVKVTEPTNDETQNICKYSISDKENMIISLVYKTAEEVKKSEVDAGNRVETIAQIPMSNYIVRNPDGIIISSNLVLSEAKILTIKLIGEQYNNDKKLELATNIAKEINNYR